MNIYFGTVVIYMSCLLRKICKLYFNEYKISLQENCYKEFIWYNYTNLKIEETMVKLQKCPSLVEENKYIT